MILLKEVLYGILNDFLLCEEFLQEYEHCRSDSHNVREVRMEEGKVFPCAKFVHKRSMRLHKGEKKLRFCNIILGTSKFNIFF